MATSLPNPAPSARAQAEGKSLADHPAEARLRGLTSQQLHDRLAWLSWYQPGVFTAVMDYMEFCDALAADLPWADI
jgi:hypothetical protein